MIIMYSRNPLSLKENVHLKESHISWEYVDDVAEIVVLSVRIFM